MAFFAIIGTAAKFFGTLYGLTKSAQAYADKKQRRQVRSRTYKTTEAETDVDREEPLPIVYGRNRVTGTLIYRETTELENDAYDAAYAFCEGECESVNDVQLNGVTVDDLTGSTATTYTGADDQTGDSIFETGLFRIEPEACAFASSNLADTAMSATFPDDVRVCNVSHYDRGFLRFDFSSLPPDLTIDSARLVMYSTLTSDGNGKVIASSADSEVWVQDEITWNTMPAIVAEITTPQKTTDSWTYNKAMVFNATGITYLQTQYDAATTATLILSHKTSTGNVQITYASKRSEYPTPYLEIKYTGGDPCGYRNTAYVALHIDPSNEKLGTADPTVTALIQGRKVSVWDGDEYVTEYSRNPAWQLYDILTNSRFGAGISTTDIDDATFKTIASYCDVEVTDIDGATVPRYTSDIVIDGGSNGFDAVNAILRTCAGFLYMSNGKICLGAERSVDTIETGLLLDAALTDSSVVIGPELITNGDFSSWSGAADPNNKPMGWTKSTTDATNFFQDAANACRFVNDGTSSGYVYPQSAMPLPAGKTYQYGARVTAAVSGAVKWTFSNAPNMNEVVTYATLGRTASAGTFTISRVAGSAVDITLTDATLKEYYLSDASSYDRHLSPSNEPTWNTLSSGLKVMNFNGTTDLIDTGSDWIAAIAVSIEALIRPETAGENSAGHILCNGKLVIALDNTNGRISVTSDGGTTTVYSGTGAWAANTWTHLVVTRTAAGLINIYVNGYLSGSAGQDSGTPAAGSTNVFIGNRSAADRTFDGDIPHVRGYLGGLDTDQIYNLSVNTPARYGV